ncbi:cytochrome P450 [Aspergillus mulundensis]|uniref:Cytochrome P450 n=1 Tax=Aspergillus mulundensis TaxID=1810919 RepID=A0A3D8QJB7_9EURO|nr:hypothetical protein DSM5745_10480 [Aspergillus mulundensis]RDW61808.1 hypothetical protein DSM5745_10480 [Aspergillus mulundensis]
MLSVSSLYSPWTWVTTALLYLISRTIYNIYFHPLSIFPGPKLRAATRLAWVYSMTSGANHRNIKRLHERYGPVVRVAPNELSFISPSAWQDIYTKGPSNKGLVRAETVSDAAGPKHIFATHNDSHTRLRRKLMQTLSEHGVAKHEPLIQGYLNTLIAKLHRESEDGRLVNINDWINWFAFDIIGDLALSESFHQLDNSAPDGWIVLLTTYIKGLLVSFCLNYYWPLNRVLPTLAPKTYQRLQNQFMDPIHEKINRRLARPDAEHLDDIIGSCMPHANGGKMLMDPEYLTGTMAVLLAAGSETAATALSAVMNLLVNNTRAMQKLCAEVRAIPTSQELTLAAVSQMPYLDAVITEGLRLCHPITWSISRLTPATGCVIGDWFVPGNTHVNILHYAVYNSDTHFPNAHEFLPERWLGEDAPDQSSNAAFQPFSMGGHSCPGRPVECVPLAGSAELFDLAKEADAGEVETG